MKDRLYFTKSKIDFVPDKPGIYFIWKGETNTCYYIGKAEKSIKTRLLNHLRSPSLSLRPYLQNQDAKFSYEIMENSDKVAIKAKESEYIKSFNPHGNISESKRRSKNG